MEKEWRYTTILTTLLLIAMLLISNIGMFLDRDYILNIIFFWVSNVLCLVGVPFILGLNIFKNLNKRRYAIGYISGFIIGNGYCIIEICYEENGNKKYVQTFPQLYCVYLLLGKIVIERDNYIGKKVLFFLNKKKNKCFIKRIYNRMY